MSSLLPSFVHTTQSVASRFNEGHCVAGAPHVPHAGSAVARVQGCLTTWSARRAAVDLPQPVEPTAAVRRHQQATLRLVLGVPAQQLAHHARCQHTRGVKVCDAA